MILVTGAFGTVGSLVVDQLRAGGHAVRAMTRTPGRSAPGAEVVQADLDDADAVARAVAGVRAVFLLTAPPTPTPRHDLTLLDAARAAGVESVVKLSAIGTGEQLETGQVVGSWHAAAERAVRASGLAWTVLRPSSFATNCLSWAGAIRDGSPVPNLTGRAKQGVIDPEDIARVAVVALTATGHDRRTYTLTGPELLDVDEQAWHVAQVLGRPVTTVDVPPATARPGMLAAGMHPDAVDAALTGVSWARAGHNTVLTDDVAELTGRPSRTFRDWADRHRHVLSGGPSSAVEIGTAPADVSNSGVGV